MRIWSLPVNLLCNQHLLGEHKELHSIYTIITEGRIGYSHHPEVKRWQGHVGALVQRHEAQAGEMRRRGMNHKSPIARIVPEDTLFIPLTWDSYEDQYNRLKLKNCKCKIAWLRGVR